MGGRIITGSVNCSDITVNKDLITKYSNSNTAISEGTKDLEVTVNRREYSIVGDELYIPKRYEDAPQWLRDIIDTVTSTALSNALSDVSTLGDMLDGLIAELNVAKNTYTMSIISDNDINERITAAIETLNSSLAESDSTILNIAMTRVTPEQAQAIVIGILSASINGGDIAAAVQNLQSAIADVDSARALDYTRLNASISDEFESSATAISTINAYVGIDEAGASTGTGLSAYLEDSNGVIGGADSELNNTIKATAEGIESKFEYNSIVNINGVYKKSGFGLTTNYTSGSGTEANPYVSEFWIDASRLKFTNSNVTGQTAPFTIDASGTTPQVTFNGKVAFTNVTGYTAPTKLSEFVNDSGYVLPTGVAAAINNNTTTINGSKITTGSIAAAQIAAGTITSDKISTYNLTAANATFANSIITNATIANGAITNAKIGDASIDAAKIIDGNITNAKIGYASVDTLKIQGEAIVVPRFAEAIGSNRATIYYTPTVTHTVLLICNVQWSNGGQYYVIGVNGAVHKNGIMGSYGSSTFTKAFSISTLVTLSAGVAYSLTFQLSGNGGYYNTAVSEWTQITMMGAKR